MTPKGKKNGEQTVPLNTAEMRSVLMGQPDFLLPVVPEAVPAILEVEMAECLQARQA